MSNQSDEELRLLWGKALLAILCFLVLSAVAFSAFSKEMALDKWITSTVGAVITTIVWWLWRRHGNAQSNEDDTPTKRLLVMYVEDVPAQQDFIRWSFRRMNVKHDLAMFDSAEEALKTLQKRSASGMNITPDVIVVDLFLGDGKMTGQELIKRITTDQDLFEIPIIVYSAKPPDTRSQEEIDQQAFAKAYIDKARGPKALAEALDIAANPENKNRQSYDDLCNKVAELRKLNHEFRGALAMFVSAFETKVDYEMQKKIVDNAIRVLSKQQVDK